MAQETWVQSLVESYQRLKKWYLMPPCLTHSIIRYGSRVKWSNPGKGVVPSPTHRCCSYRKRAFGSLSTMVANFTFTYSICAVLILLSYNHLTENLYYCYASLRVVIYLVGHEAKMRHSVGCSEGIETHFGEYEHPFIAIAPWSTLARRGSTW